MQKRPEYRQFYSFSFCFSVVSNLVLVDSYDLNYFLCFKLNYFAVFYYQNDLSMWKRLFQSDYYNLVKDSRLPFL